MAGVPFMVLGFLFLVVGLFYWVRGLLEERIRRRLQQEGTDTKAVVLSHQVLRQERGWWTIYYVAYRYYHQGQSYEKAERVNSPRYNDWPRGTLIPVRYLPQNPYIVRIASEGSQFLVVGKVLLAIGFFFMAVALLFILTL